MDIPPLDQQIRAELEKRRGEWLQIAKDADVSHSWMSKFVNGHIDNPGYATLMRLHALLITKPEAPAKVAA